MSRGAFTINRKCAFCRNHVNEIDATWEDGQPYHDHCFRQKTRKEIAALEKKMRRGTLSLVEAKDLGELKEIDFKIRNENTPMASGSLSKAMIPDTPVFHGNTPLGLHSASTQRPGSKRAHLTYLKSPGELQLYSSQNKDTPQLLNSENSSLDSSIKIHKER